MVRRHPAFTPLCLLGPACVVADVFHSQQLRPPRPPLQTTPLVAGLAVGAAAYGARAALQAFTAWKAAGPRMRAFYKGEQSTGANRGWAGPDGVPQGSPAASPLPQHIRSTCCSQLCCSVWQPPADPRLLPCPYDCFPAGGFQPDMTRREAALILGVRESAPEEKVRPSDVSALSGMA